MLAGEEARQERLKSILRADRESASKVDESNLMHSYKQFQFFDTLALYFNRIHDGAREKAVFPHVPMSATRDVDVTITPMSEDRYEASPWPVYGESLQVSFEGRYMQPAASGTKTASEASKLPIEKQVVTLSVLDSVG